MKKFKFKNLLGFKFRKANTAQWADSASAGKTDVARWSENSSFPASWSSRAAFAAAMIQDYKSVCDIGCGMQDLRRELGPDVTYLPMDVVQRTSDTMVCEINKKLLPTDYMQRAEVTSLLGVIEYLVEPEWLLSEIAGKCSAMLVSYCLVGADESLDKRLQRGWMNNFSEADFESLLRNAGWKVKLKQRFATNQMLWLCEI